MSVNLVQKVYGLRNIPAVPKNVLVNLAWHMNDETGRCFPAVERIAAETGYARSTVFEKLQWLEDHGYVRVVRPKKVGRGLANEYHLTLEKGSATRTLSERGLSTTGIKKVRRAGEKRSVSRTPTKEIKNEPKEPAQKSLEAVSLSDERSAALSMMNGRAADRPSLGGELQTDMPVPAVIAAASAERAKRASDENPVHLHQPIISADQRRHNQAVERLEAGLLQCGKEFYAAAAECLDESLHAQAVAAEAVRAGSGVALVRLEMQRRGKDR
ncbi:helix-turn-helix domain-containing protein [Mesorhizobium caraganae]|uniref:Helix-turn-helix domain-containing protein n=1 Tax=Mesorhizobium caraganae TaxID=483206 RepID=A0ABV1YVC0_9HYPH